MLIQSPKLSKSSSECGFTTLLMILIILLLVTSISIYSNYAFITQQRVMTQQYNQAQAFQAAEAGLNYAIAYFNTSQADILSTLGSTLNATYKTPTNFSLPSLSNHAGTTSLVLGSITYTLTAINPHNLITVTVIGKSLDGSASLTLTQQIAYSGTVVPSILNNALVTKGNISMNGSAKATNNDSSSVVMAGGSVTSGNQYYSSNVGAYVNCSSSNPCGVSSTLASERATQFFSDTFNTTLAALTAGAVQSTRNDSLPAGQLIYNVPAGGVLNLTGNDVYGSANAPIILIVNGDLRLSGTVKIYGLVYIMGTSALGSSSGNTFITGAIVSEGDLTLSGNTTVQHSNSVLNNINLSSFQTYTPIAGSWKDF